MTGSTIGKDEQPSPLDYFVVQNGTVKMGPYTTAKKAENAAMEEAKEQLEYDEHDSFAAEWIVKPEMWCVNDPRNRWSIYHINQDNHISIAEYSDGKWEVGIFNSDDEVVDDEVIVTDNLQTAFLTICTYAMSVFHTDRKQY